MGLEGRRVRVTEERGGVLLLLFGFGSLCFCLDLFCSFRDSAVLFVLLPLRLDVLVIFVPSILPLIPSFSLSLSTRRRFASSPLFLPATITIRFSPFDDPMISASLFLLDLSSILIAEAKP